MISMYGVSPSPFSLATETGMQACGCNYHDFLTHLAWVSEYRPRSQQDCHRSRMVKVKILQALDTLVGLRAEPAEHGGYKYTHRSTGYTFEIRPVQAHSVAEDEMILPGEQELVFVPLSIGHAAEVAHLSHSLQHSVQCGLE